MGGSASRDDAVAKQGATMYSSHSTIHEMYCSCDEDAIDNDETDLGRSKMIMDHTPFPHPRDLANYDIISFGEIQLPTSARARARHVL